MIIPFKCDKVKLTSPYGYRTLDGKRQFHSGYDLVGVGSYDVVAAVGGRVVHSRIITDKSNATWQWGNYVCIKGDDGRYYYYCHLKSRSVAQNQTVRAGDKLGVMGNTGYSFGAHLHFEVREADCKTTVCPEEILGIPNKTGTYENSPLSQLEEDLKVLEKHGIINTPSYWYKTATRVKYLPELIHNMAEYIKR